MRFSYTKKKDINTIPKTAGVYAFFNGKEILYIGKAANLLDRVKNHFTQPSYRDNLFVSQVTKVGYCETKSEIDALILESQLIKSSQPKYNVTWKDDKKYFYVAITKETLPRVFLTHQPSVPKSDLGHPKSDLGVIGPFVEGRDIKQVLRLLRKVFPYYTAKKHPVLACPYCHIGLCPGPEPYAKEYRQNIRNLVSVLKGRRVSVLNSLRTSMEQASKEQDFEKAAMFRNQLFALERIALHRSVSLSMPWQYYRDTLKEPRPLPKPWRNFSRIEAYDISNIQGKQATGSMVTFLNGKPAKEWYRKFKIKYPGRSTTPRHGGLGARARQKQAVVSGPNDFAMMEELISRRLKHAEWPYPDLMLIDGGKGQLSSTLKAVSNLIRLSYGTNRKLNRIKLRHIKIVALAKRNNELFSPKKAKPVLLQDLPREVANLLLHVRDEAHRFAITYHRKLRRVDALKSS